MKLNSLDLNKLRVFCAVIEHNGYKGASERLGMTRSAISQTITTLEVQIDAPLFHRSGTKLLVTDTAKNFYTEIMRYQNGLEQALQQFSHGKVAPTGLLRIGAYLEFTKGKLMPVLESFLNDNPNAQVQFYFDAPSKLEVQLEKDRIDLAISIFPHPNKKIESHKLFQQELCLIARKDLVGVAPTSTELSQLPVIDYFTSHLLFKRWWTLHYRKAPIGVAPRVFAATAEMVLELVERRLGVGVVPRYLLENASNEIHIIAPTPKKLVDHLWINRQRRKKLSTLEKNFFTRLKEAFE